MGNPVKKINFLTFLFVISSVFSGSILFWIIGIITTGFLIFSLPSCKKDIGKIPVTQSCDTATYTYTNSIHEIFVTNCALSGCHDAITKQNGFDHTTYEGPVNAAKGIGVFYPGDSLLCLIKGTCASGLQMPYNLPKLPDSTISKIERWINSGMCR